MNVIVKSVYTVTRILLTPQIVDGLLIESSIHYNGAK